MDSSAGGIGGKVDIAGKASAGAERRRGVRRQRRRREDGEEFASRPPLEATRGCDADPEIAMLGEMAGLEVVATYGDMDERVPLDSEDAHNMLVVLKKDHQ